MINDPRSDHAVGHHWSRAIDLCGDELGISARGGIERTASSRDAKSRIVLTDQIRHSHRGVVSGCIATRHFDQIAAFEGHCAEGLSGGYR